jgi:hypothetical protein
MEKCEVYISFKNEIIQVEEIGGINQHFIVFNPEMNNGVPDYRIQFSYLMMLKFENVDKLIPILDFPDEFIMINSKGEEISRSEDTNPEFVELILEKLENDGTLALNSEVVN